MAVVFTKGDKVEFVAGNGKVYKGTFVRRFFPAKNAGAHFIIDIDHGVKATIFANGTVGKSVKKVSV